MGLSDQDEEKLRRLAREKFNNKKGAIAKVVSEGLSGLETGSKREEARQRLIAGMEKGFHGGRILYKHRSELYERRTLSR